MDLQGLNIFGVPVEEDALMKDTATSMETKRVLKDLIDILDQGDSNELQNFTIRKSFAYYDVSVESVLTSFSHILQKNM